MSARETARSPYPSAVPTNGPLGRAAGVRSRPPLLRSPPFPGVPVDVAAVSRRDPAARDRRAYDPNALLSALVDARVGGTFWAPPLDWPKLRRLLRPASAEEAQQLARAPDLDRAGIGVLLPAAPWASAVAAALEADGFHVAIGDVDPWSLLRNGVVVAAHGDDEWLALGLLAGAAVQPLSNGCFTDLVDSDAVLRRELVVATRYRDCFTGRPADIAAAIEQLGAWRRLIEANRGIAAATGMAWWKRRQINAFLWADRRHPLHFTRSSVGAVEAARIGSGGIAVWPSRAPGGLPAAAAGAGVPLIQVEDGFVRSAGLGADCRPPFSIVVDRTGIHYDPSGPSDLETLLETADFPPALLARGEALARLIVREGISKYGAHRPSSARDRQARRRVLVAGQVEDDMSVLLGGAGLTNRDLLARARAAEPDAELWFRPHPDVDAGHRRGGIPDDEAKSLADRIVREESMADLLAQVEGVHVLTSLTGFEALLRGCAVTTHGQPFYAGWGLTHDLAPPIPRRTRRLTLPQLVAGVLVLYPRYLDPVTGLPCPPEVLMRRLVAGEMGEDSWLIRLRQWQGRILKAIGARAS